MPNEIFRQNMISRIRAAIRDSALVAGQLSHPGVTGKLREFLVEQILQSVLPDRFQIGTGIVTDQFGTQSNETDIVVYDGDDLRPLIFGNTNGVFPVESVKYVFEVKSELNAREIKTTVAKFRNLLNLRSMTTHPIRILVAWSTDLKTVERELDRYLENDPAYLDGPAIDSICVIGKGYWYFFPERKGSQTTIHRWSFIPSTDDHIELMGLVAGMANTLNRRSPLGYYILPPDNSPVGYIEIPNWGIKIPSILANHYNEYITAFEKGHIDRAASELKLALPDIEMRSRFLRLRDPENQELMKFTQAMVAQHPELLR